MRLINETSPVMLNYVLVVLCLTAEILFCELKCYNVRVFKNVYLHLHLINVVAVSFFLFFIQGAPEVMVPT